MTLVSGLVVVYIREYMGREYSRGIKIKRLGLVGGGWCQVKLAKFSQESVFESTY